MLRRRILLSALILAGLGITVYSRFQAAEAEAADCPITSVMINEDAVPNEEGAIEVTPENSTVKCFDTPAQSMRYITNGAVDLPNDASQQEADEAYQVYYEKLSASENKPE